MQILEWGMLLIEDARCLMPGPPRLRMPADMMSHQVYTGQYQAIQSTMSCIRIPGIYPCVRSIPVKNKKKLFFLVWNFNWNWNWDWSWNDLRECQKLWGGLCILHRTYTGGEAPATTTIKYTSLHRVLDTPSSHSNFNPHPNSNSNLKSNIKK